MGGRHHSGRDAGGRLYVPGHSPVHRMAAHVKIVALVLFVLAVVATPPRAVWAFLAYAAILAAVAASAGLSARLILPRMLVEVPFLLFAVLMPVFGPEPYSQVLGLSVPGLWAAWGIIAKATIGVVGSVILAATTPTRDLLGGLAQLRVPDLIV